MSGRTVGARTSEAQESAAGAALVAISEDTSRIEERRLLRDVALVWAGAEIYVCLRVKKN